MQDKPLRDERLGSLFKRISEYEQRLKAKTALEERTSKYQSKVYTRDLKVKKEYMTDMLMKAVMKLYRDIQPYLPSAIHANDLYENLDGKNLFEGVEGLDVKAEDTLLIMLPTFKTVNAILKMHYIYIAFRDVVNQARIDALSNLYRTHAQLHSRRKGYTVDAVTVYVIANRAEISESESEGSSNNSSDNNNNNNNKDKKKILLLGNCKKAIVLIGYNNADILNRLTSILVSFYSSKLAGIYAKDQIRHTSKYALKTFFMKNPSALLSHLIKNGTLDLPITELSLNQIIREITIRLLSILEMFKNIFTITASTVRDTYHTMSQELLERMVEKIKKKMERLINGMHKDMQFYITRKAMILMLRQDAIADMLIQFFISSAKR